jgi:hypothetical protein
MEKTENQDTDIQKQTTEKTDQEIESNDRRPASKFITTEGRIVDAIEAILPEDH